MGSEGSPAEIPAIARRRTATPPTAHACARAGDLAGLTAMLARNPSLVNARNPIFKQTPLHIAAAFDKTNIVQFMLEWEGKEKIELDANNMYGETPLHMAAKNGSCEAMRLLLERGAVLEAKANNGMTALHLSVWHANSTEDCTAVATLLEYNADCDAKDKEGKIPLDLFEVREGPTYVEVKQLFSLHIEKHRKRKALESYGEATAKMMAFEHILENIVGLQELKMQLHKWARGMIFDEKRRALGMNIGARKPPHMAFLGNPGTGKTMVARVLGKLLQMVGVLPTDKVTEVQRTDLVGEFVGHTGTKTRRKIKEAMGGILFVDEAYRLIPLKKSDDKDFGLEALEEIMSEMDSGKVVVIFAGYSEQMKRVIASNEGFCRRVTKFFYFNDFTVRELAQIVHLKMNSENTGSSLYGFKLHPSCTIEAVARSIERVVSVKQRKEMNGGLIDPLLNNARENLDCRLDMECSDIDSLVTITMDDLEAGLQLLSQQKAPG